MDSRRVRFGILGPLEVTVDGRPVAIRAAQSAKLLAALLLERGHVVSVGSLTEVLWDGEPPATARQQIHKTVARLRRLIPDVIDTDAAGYRIGEVQLDARKFAELAGEPSIEGLTAALALWRGPVLAGVDSRELQSRSRGLAERRLTVTEKLLGLRLHAGQAADVAVELPALIAAHPLREGLRALHMEALLDCGRRAEALAVYAEVRALLAEELGLDPGPELRRIHQRALGAGEDTSVPRAPCTLPYDLPDFTGRATDVARLLSAARSRPIQVVDGMAGSGKTSLVVHAAHRLASGHPDGQLFVDLQGYTPGARPLDPAATLESLLRTIGVPAQAIPDSLADRAAAWRDQLADRRVLLVLDNAADCDQVRPLLPGSPRCLTLITSRGRLGGLDGAGSLTVGSLPVAQAVELLGRIGGERVAADPAAAREVALLCGRLPLAIRIAGTRLAHRPAWTVESLARRLRDETGRLGQLVVDHRAVAAAFAVSHQHLGPAEQRVFRLLGVHPGAGFDRHAVAALARCSPEHAEESLERLVDAHLLHQPSPDRYALHDLLRAYARQLGCGDDAGTRLHDYYLTAARRATGTLNPGERPAEPDVRYTPRHLPRLPDREAALAWLTAEHRNLLAVARDWRLPAVLSDYFEYAGYFPDWRATHEWALERTEEPLPRAVLHINLGVLAGWTNRFDHGIGHLRSALRTVGDPATRAGIMTSLGMLLHQAHRDTEAVAELRAALALNPGNPRVTAMATCNLGLATARTGRADEAMDLHRRAVALARECRSGPIQCAAWLGAGESALRTGAPALAYFQRALRLSQRSGFRIQQALALDGLAHATGDAAHWRRALKIFSDVGAAQAESVRDHLSHPGRARCDMCAVAVVPAGRSRGRLAARGHDSSS
ncbi:BTAD domain-containing putative transcriptional regulator [Streptomyces sp. KLOTTS4A1]|uniref:AfsR/SARP family transcriptional regulator n=1 Tax=Streptomyces sp. KLOTTS4A1 TaxID=3390996 RepID=UPI0039F50FAD